MPLVDKKELAEKYGPSEDNKMILFATKPEKKKENPRLPDFRGYISDDKGNVFEVAGWRNKSEKGTITLSGKLENVGHNIHGTQTKEEPKPEPQEGDDDYIPF